jgi:hypothetical protein
MCLVLEKSQPFLYYIKASEISPPKASMPRGPRLPKGRARTHQHPHRAYIRRSATSAEKSTGMRLQLLSSQKQQCKILDTN